MHYECVIDDLSFELYARMYICVHKCNKLENNANVNWLSENMRIPVGHFDI